MTAYRDDIEALEAEAEELRRKLAVTEERIAHAERVRAAKRREGPGGPPYWVSCLLLLVFVPLALVLGLSDGGQGPARGLQAEIARLRVQLAAAEDRLAALRAPEDADAEARAADARTLRRLAFGAATIVALGALLAPCVAR